MSYSQPGIFNVLDYGMSLTKAGQDNANALQSAIDDAVGQGGGIILIPSTDQSGVKGSYAMAPQTDESYGVKIDGSVPLKFLGMGGTILTMEETEPYDLFVIDSGDSDANIGGVTFQDLHLAYAEGNSSGAAIRVVKGQNVRLFRVVLTACPQAVVFENALQCSMIACTAYTYYSANAGVAVTIGTNAPDACARDIYIAGCTFESAWNIGGVGVQILAADQVRLVSNRIEAFTVPIMIAPGPTGGNASNIFLDDQSAFSASTDTDTGASLLVQPQGDASVINLQCVACEFTPGEDTTHFQYAGSGVYLDTSGGGIIAQVRFLSCYSCRWMASGLEINGGTDIEVIGGYYSCNGTNTDALTRSGIALTGTAPESVERVRVDGAGCNNLVDDINGSPLPATQVYGVSIAAGASEILLRNCDLACTAPGPNVLVDTAATDVQITNCAGYNDLATNLNPTGTLPSGTFDSTTFGYYGPMAFCFDTPDAPTAVTIDSQDTGLLSGAFTLARCEDASVTYYDDNASFQGLQTLKWARMAGAGSPCVHDSAEYSRGSHAVKPALRAPLGGCGLDGAVAMTVEP